MTEEEIIETSVDESTDSSTESEDQQSQVDTQTTEPEQDNSTSGEDQFFDPNNIPEELKPAYKQMQAAFTKKTQEIAQARKEAESIRVQAEAYKRYEQYIPLLDEMMAKRTTQPVEDPRMQSFTENLRSQGYSDEAIELAKAVMSQTQEQFKEFTTQQQAEQFSKQVESNIEEAGKLDPRLSDSKLTYEVDGEQMTFGQIVEQLVAADPNWTKNPVAATQKAIRTVDALIGKAKTEGKQELSAKAKQQAAKFPQVSSSPQSAANANRNLSIREAVAEAQQEIGN